jgi:NitT/TauT family transport system substrate-binding protein
MPEPSTTRTAAQRGRLTLGPVLAAGLAALLAACGSPSHASTPTTHPSTGNAAPGSSAPAGSAPADAAPTVTVKVGYQPDLHGAGMLDIGRAHGYFQRFGINVEPVKFSDGPTEMQAMAGGDIQFGYLGPGAVWIPASGRADIITVDSLEVGDWVVGQPGVTNLGDLKGKSVGYSPGTSGEMILRLALQKARLTMHDIHPVKLTSTEVVPAFVAHHIDAAASWVPLVQAIKAHEPQAHFLINDKPFAPTYNFPDIWVASPSEVKDHPDVVVRFLEGFALANNYRLAHPAETIDRVSSQADVPASGLAAQNAATQWIDSKTLAQDYANGSATQWLTNLERLLSSVGKLPQSVPASRFTAFNLFQQAEANAGA